MEDEGYWRRPGDQPGPGANQFGGTSVTPAAPSQPTRPTQPSQPARLDRPTRSDRPTWMPAPPPGPPGPPRPGEPYEPEEPPRRGRRLLRALTTLVVLALVVLGSVHLIDNYQATQRAEAERQARAAAAAIQPKIVRGPLSPNEVTALAKKVGPTLADIETEMEYAGKAGAGTGIVLTANGDVLTNNHVINGATDIHVVLVGTRKRYPAKVIGYDRTHDIAVLRMSGVGKLKPAAIGDSGTVGIGDPIMGIGHDGGGGRTSNAPGTVSALDATVTASDALTGSTERLQNLIKVAADIKPGFSGGPLINADGQIVGVNTAASVNYQYKTPTGTGFAIPINDAMRIAQQIQEGQPSETVHIGPTGILGVVVTGRLLVDPSEGDYRSQIQAQQQQPPGARVAAVAFGSPAEGAGLAVGDLIVSLDGSPVDGPTALTSLVGQRRPGDKVTLEWIDGTGQRKTGAATLVEGPPA